MNAVCLYFKIHQPFRLKRYRFFDIGNDHYYYDDFSNDNHKNRPTLVPARQRVASPDDK